MAGRSVAEFLKQAGRVGADKTKSGVKQTGAYVKDVSGIRKDRPESVIMAAPRMVGNVTADAAIGSVKLVNKMAPFTRKTPESIGNLYTGRKAGPGAAIAAGGLGLGYAGFTSHKETTFAHKLGQTEYVGAAPVMNSDGVGQTTNAPTLGASGSTVFGLHSARKG